MAKSGSLLLSSWRHHYQGVNSSPQQIFSSIEQAMVERDIPDVELTRVVHKEGGIFSRRREYIRVQRKEYYFDIAASPFGQGILVSWYLREEISFFWRAAFIFPLLGTILIRLLRPDSYHRIDRSWAFQASVHSAVIEALDGHAEARGYRDLFDDTQKPINLEFFKDDIDAG